MTTRILLGADGLTEAAQILMNGGVAAFPTETVYGLGADATNPTAVARIFQAKGRPSDNPLIVHIAQLDEWALLASDINEQALTLAKRFWPGPLTIVLPRTNAVPDIVTAGLTTVGVRMPAHPLALALIRQTGRPLAAPSANHSGRPSPTTARDVLADLDGCIPLILDGGACSVGVESTVLDLSRNPPVLLRPGGVTIEELREYLPNIVIDPASLSPMEIDTVPSSPGMKYRHYAPNIPLTVVIGECQVSTLARLYDETLSKGSVPILLLSEETAALLAPRRCITIGSYNDPAQLAGSLFSALRSLDEHGATAAFAESFPTDGVGLALMNRLLRAAGFKTIG
ncbi:threonylcarbamoyl-AMP synthase [Clostridia bacterium]|nr:threonylcarbamoyl-AMP synthase [Clostridia bacterium]